MDDKTLLGFYFYPSKYNHELGHAALDVYLASEPQGWVFDTRAAAFAVANTEGVHHVQVTHPWPQPQQQFAIFKDRFFMVSHDGKVVEGYCAGGDLEVEVQGDITCCHLTSPAPIFDLEAPFAFTDLLVPEVEAELARLRARWTGSDSGFDRQLAEIPPLTFFVASLNLVKDYLYHLPQFAVNDQVLADRATISQAIHSLKNAGEWPADPPTLRQLFHL